MALNCNGLIKFLLLFYTVFLCGCSGTVILHPQGYIGSSERSLIIIAALLMLIVVLPAIFMTIIFAWRYRESNKKAKYSPDWQSSRKLEIIIWIVPSIIITILSVIVWIDTHKLDPYRPLKSTNTPLVIQVISLNWKWLFIYPQQQIATVNKIVFPVNVPIHFYLTSDSLMNSFFIPQLGSQIMTMPGMQTQLFLLADTPGTYSGISANFSGFGFTGMTFNAIATSAQQFQDWVSSVQQLSKKLDQDSYRDLARPSVNNPVDYFSSVPPNLFMSVTTSSE